MLLAPRPRKRVHLFQAGKRHVLHQLRWRGKVRHRPDRANSYPICIPASSFPFRIFRVFRGYIRIHLRQSDELIQPPVGRHDVVIQQDQVVSLRDLQALVDRGRKAEVLYVAHDRHLRRGDIMDPDEIDPRPIRRAIIDDDQLPRRSGVPHQSGEAKAGDGAYYRVQNTWLIPNQITGPPRTPIGWAMSHRRVARSRNEKRRTSHRKPKPGPWTTGPQWPFR